MKSESMIVSVLIPSRLQKYSNGRLEDFYFRRAANSVWRQSAVLAGKLQPQIIVALDAGVMAPADQTGISGVEFVNSRGTTHAVALNAAAKKIRGDFVAFLEDDDLWQPEFLNTALEASQSHAFVSSSQAEVTPTGRRRRIVDYPTPSCWFMPRQIWEAVGDFDESFRLSIDSEWLGRLNERPFRRVHLVEATAPPIDTLNQITIFDWLTGRRKKKKQRFGLLRILAANANSTLLRHHARRPLVVRAVHGNSLHSEMKRDDRLRRVRDLERERLIRRFGKAPW